MPRKPPDPKKIKQFTLLAASNESVLAIKELTGLSDSTISKWKLKYHKEIEEKRKEIKNIRKKEAIMEGEPVPEDEEQDEDIQENSRILDTSKKEKPPSFKSIEQETTRKAIDKGSASVSDRIAKEIASDYAAVQVLKGARLRYQKNIEEIMGLKWDEFVAVSLDMGYVNAELVYKDKMSEILYENTQLATEIEGDEEYE